MTNIRLRTLKDAPASGVFLGFEPKFICELAGKLDRLLDSSKF